MTVVLRYRLYGYDEPDMPQVIIWEDDEPPGQELPDDPGALEFLNERAFEIKTEIERATELGVPVAIAHDWNEGRYHVLIGPQVHTEGTDRDDWIEYNGQGTGNWAISGVKFMTGNVPRSWPLSFMSSVQVLAIEHCPE